MREGYFKNKLEKSLRIFENLVRQKTLLLVNKFLRINDKDVQKGHLLVHHRAKCSERNPFESLERLVF